MKSPGKPSLRRDVERLFWHEIAKGASSAEAALAVGASQAAGSRWFRERGGMATFMLEPLSGRYLSFAEREEIALLRAQHVGVREIARRLGRHPSTISRELRRNAATRGGKLKYRASVAQWKAELMARRPKTVKLVADERLRDYVQDRLAGQVRRPDGTAVAGPATTPWKGRSKPHRADRRWASAWSPEQISARLKIDFPEDESMRISHEAIYQALFVQSRGALRRELVACLPWMRCLSIERCLTRCIRKRACSRSRRTRGSGSQISGTRSRCESTASTRASILSVLHASGARPLTLAASAISTSQPSASRWSCTNRAPVIDSITARTGRS